MVKLPEQVSPSPELTPFIRGMGEGTRNQRPDMRHPMLAANPASFAENFNPSIATPMILFKSLSPLRSCSQKPVKFHVILNGAQLSEKSQPL